MGPDLPFALIGGIEGREEEVLSLGGVVVHPNVFHAALEDLPVAGWQVVERAGSVRILLVRPRGPLPDVAARIRTELEGVGTRGIGVTIDVVDDIPRTALGKAPLVRHAA